MGRYHDQTTSSRTETQRRRLAHRLETRPSCRLAPALSLVVLVSCSSGTGPANQTIHGGPDDPASDGSYTEAIDSPNGIASLEPVTLGGVEQWILIRGQNTSNPVLVFLHGGPGSPAIPYARFSFKPLEQQFTVVSWDQRGCGKSYSAGIDPQSLTFDQLFSDAYELILQMKTRFDAERVFLMGISWGAILGVHLADAYPELLYAYVGIGQPVNLARALGISTEFAIEQATESGNQVVLEQLRDIRDLWQSDPALAWEQTGPLLGWLESHGYGDLHDLSLYASLAQEAGPLTEYTSQDMANEASWRSLYDASPLEEDTAWWMGIDLPEDIPRLEVPVVFMTGRYDYKAPLELVEEYVTGLEAPEGTLLPFEESAHVVFLEQRTLFRNTMIDTVAPYATR
jgi:pimeloyl-ACP methyl ester carboxylesterase